MKKPMKTKEPTNVATDWIADAVRDLPALCKLVEVAAATRVSVRHLRRHVDSGQIRTLRANGEGPTRLLIPRAEVARFLETMITGTGSRGFNNKF